MAPKVLEKPATFGARILQLAGDRAITDLARDADLDQGTLYRWTKRKSAPRGQRDRIARLEAVLGGRLVDDAHGEDPAMQNRMNESRGEYAPRRPRRGVVQPLDFKKKALDAAGRARHYISRLLARFEDENDLGPEEAEIIEALRNADREIAESQQHLLGRIEINDEGKPV